MNSFKPYQTYVKHLQSLICTSARSRSIQDNELYFQSLSASLDGEASLELRKLISIENLRRDGAFFTSTQLASDALSNVAKNQTYFDPACGAGNLLVECARKLPILQTLKATLTKWGDQLIGRDIHKEFVDATRARIALSAIHRGARFPKECNIELEKLLPNIKVGNSLLDGSLYEKCSHIVINPPFTLIDAPRKCSWSSGLTNSAALFIETCVLNAKSQTQITAILPDVLRTGSRYQRWRDYISNKIKILSIRSVGQFDPDVDIDVFVLDCIKLDNSEHSSRWWQTTKRDKIELIGDLFDVHVGPVVPHRHLPKGKLMPYIHAKNIPPGQVIREFSESRRFEGTVFQPPFVVIRRTSRPEHKYRAMANIIGGAKALAVENHLIICKPKNGTLSACKRLISILHSETATKWLNNRIRCRHLTVSAIKEFPLKETAKRKG